MTGDCFGDCGKRLDGGMAPEADGGAFACYRGSCTAKATHIAGGRIRGVVRSGKTALPV